MKTNTAQQLETMKESVLRMRVAVAHIGAEQAKAASRARLIARLERAQADGYDVAAQLAALTP